MNFAKIVVLILTFVGLTSDLWASPDSNQNLTQNKIKLPLIQFIVMEETQYTDEKVHELAANAVKVFEQCGISSEISLQIDRKSHHGLNGSFDLFDFESPISILKEFRSQKYEAPLKVFLVTQFHDKDYSAGLSFAEWTDVLFKDTDKEMAGTVWVATDTMAKLDLDPEKKYNTLAHELSHILTRYGQHNGKQTPNLLGIYMRRTNYILPEDCQTIRDRFQVLSPALVR